jgi:hypothetical protein
MIPPPGRDGPLVQAVEDLPKFRGLGRTEEFEDCGHDPDGPTFASAMRHDPRGIRTLLRLRVLLRRWFQSTRSPPSAAHSHAVAVDATPVSPNWRRAQTRRNFAVRLSDGITIRDRDQQYRSLLWIRRLKVPILPPQPTRYCGLTWLEIRYVDRYPDSCAVLRLPATA